MTDNFPNADKSKLISALLETDTILGHEAAARIAELEAALRPFAVEATLPPMPGESDDPRRCSKKYLIAARAALEKK